MQRLHPSSFRWARPDASNERPAGSRPAHGRIPHHDKQFLRGDRRYHPRFPAIVFKRPGGLSTTGMVIFIPRVRSRVPPPPPTRTAAPLLPLALFLFSSGPALPNQARVDYFEQPAPLPTHPWPASHAHPATPSTLCVASPNCVGVSPSCSSKRKPGSRSARMARAYGEVSNIGGEFYPRITRMAHIAPEFDGVEESWKAVGPEHGSFSHPPRIVQVPLPFSGANGHPLPPPAFNFFLILRCLSLENSTDRPNCAHPAGGLPTLSPRRPRQQKNWRLSHTSRGRRLSLCA